MKQFRADSLDAMRGLTIAMMVLCDTIVNWVLPLWNSHCQVPPTTGFDPSVYGITWVDLVFPFFLFAMGAAMPFSVGSRMSRGVRRYKVAAEGVWRGIKLAFFAIFIHNCSPWVLTRILGEGAETTAWLLSIAAFGVLFLLFSRWPGKHGVCVRVGVPVIGILLACFIMGWVESHVSLSERFISTDPGAFDIFNKHLDNILRKSDIIILLLGNMAAVGTLIYVCTIGKPIVRLAILPFLMAILLGKDTDGSWQQVVLNWSPFPWLYRFEFLKYLFVLIPGTIAGEFLRDWILAGGTDYTKPKTRGEVSTAMVAILSLAIIVVNVTLLFGRHLVANLYVTTLLAAVAVYFVNRMPSDRKVLGHLVKAGAIALLLGLFFEAFQGGIRKDDPTFSYYFVTSGLAFYCMAMLVIVCDVYRWKGVMKPLTLTGKNPMIAYVAWLMFFSPLMNLLGIGDSLMPFWASTWYWALGRGIMFTVLSIAIAGGFSKLKLYWRT